MKISPSSREVLAKSQLALDDWRHFNNFHPVVWCGQLHGLEFLRGNTLVARGERCLIGEVLRLVGNYPWYLVKHEKRRFAVIDVRGKDPDIDKLDADFGALEFVLGRTLQLETIAGLDPEGTVVSGAGLGFGFRRTRNIGALGPPVPEITGSGENWLPVLFPLVAKVLASHGGRPVGTLLAALLDSMTHHIDGSYLGLQVAIEAFCSQASDGAKRRPLVRDESRWRQWVAQHEKRIRGMATQRAAADVLVNKLKSAFQPASSHAVADGLSAIRLEVPSELVAETARRNISVHRFVMNRPGKRDVQEDVARVRRLQMLASALIAYGAGYRGPLCDYAADPRSHNQLADWWQATADSANARRYFRCGNPGSSPRK
ncbi:MAG: hypothetical protein QM765_39055 [Myxococcales bacterium]